MGQLEFLRLDLTAKLAIPKVQQRNARVIRRSDVMFGYLGGSDLTGSGLNGREIGQN
jgi:hypothetical protein